MPIRRAGSDRPLPCEEAGVDPRIPRLSLSLIDKIHSLA